MSETACKQVTCRNCLGRGMVSLWERNDSTVSDGAYPWGTHQWINKRCEQCHGTGTMALIESFPSLEQLAVEQNVLPVQRFEDVWGKGADIWADDEDFEDFLSATKGDD